MAHNIRSAGGRMLFGYRERVAWIHHGKFRHQKRNFKAELFLRFKVGNNGATVHFGPRRCKSQNRTERDRFRNRDLPRNNVPWVTVIVRTGSDRLSAIDRASATDRKDKIKLVFSYQRDAFFNLFYPRVGRNT